MNESITFYNEEIAARFLNQPIGAKVALRVEGHLISHSKDQLTIELTGVIIAHEMLTFSESASRALAETRSGLKVEPAPG